MKRNDWTTKPAVIIGSGPSLSDEQLQAVQAARSADRCRVIAVNNTAARAHFADIVYFGDYLALRQYLPTLRRVTTGEWWTASQAAAERWQIHVVKSCNRPGLGDERVHLNGNSGLQALNLATLFGARRVLLLGFDMRLGANGAKHWFGEHPAPLVQEMLFDEWRHKAVQIAKDAQVQGVDIVNVTPGSALTCFPAANLNEVLR